MWWSADRNLENYIETRRSRDSGPGLARFGFGFGFGFGLGVAVDLRPYLDPTRKCFLFRKRAQPTAPKIGAIRSLGELGMFP